MKKSLVFRFLFLAFLPALYGQSADPLYPAAPPPEITTPSAVLLDAETGTLLFSRNPSLVVSPASLTKLMT
ncbi:MAG: hypothetical protein LBC31_00030, partial [Treponema sp.]|nr:hypothetical protein [Treponema sp.]